MTALSNQSEAPNSLHHLLPEFIQEISGLALKVEVAESSLDIFRETHQLSAFSDFFSGMAAELKEYWRRGGKYYPIVAKNSEVKKFLQDITKRLESIAVSLQKYSGEGKAHSESSVRRDIRSVLVSLRSLSFLLEKIAEDINGSDSNSYRSDNNSTNIVLDVTDTIVDRRLTPYYLSSTVSPYLVAVADLQRTLDEVRSKRSQEIVIHAITQKSPISVSLEGASQAIETIKDTVVPWRRKHSEAMAQLSEQEKQVEIEIKRAEILEKRMLAAKSKAEAEKLAAEASTQREEAEKLRLGNEKMRLELQQARVQAALDVINRVAPNMSEVKKIEYVVKLLSPFGVLTSSELSISTEG